MSMRWLAILCVSVITGCSMAPGPNPDEISPDAAPGFTGLILEFIADSEIPAQLGADVRIGDIYLNGSVIRAVGDATTQGAQPTTSYDHELHWDLDEVPLDLEFRSAPVGEYSYVELRIAGHPYGVRKEAFEIHGEVRVDGDWDDFTIRALAPVVVANLPASMRLEASRPLTMHIELDVSRLVEGIDWSAIPKRDGKRRVDEQTPAALASFCDALGGAFRVR